MQLEIACCSDKGLVRDHNEDSLANDERLGVVVLADGMGGCQAGEVASEMAVKTIIEELKAPFKKMVLNKLDALHQNHRISGLLERAIIKANKAIYEAAEQQTRYHGMGTTVVAAVFYTNTISIAHVGDSRLYRLRNDEFKQITSDHSVLQELIDCGFYTREQARHSPNRNLVTRALGVTETVNVDVQEQNVLLEDIYLLCSDGLNDMLEDSDMHTILKDNRADLEKMAQRLIDAANEKGGEDNISVILVRPLSFSSKSPENWWEWLIKFFPFLQKS
jgi:protein phosphatase